MLRAADTVWRTDTGRQRRDNEDNAFARAPLFVVADGMGGAQAGEVASAIAVEAFEQGLPESGSPEQRLADTVREANRRIYERAQADHERAGMGTTLTAAYLDDAALAIAHVGDSRAYLFRDGSLERLTQDHSLVEELVRQEKLTPEQAAEHPQRSIITRALGPEASVEVDTWTYPVRADDVLLLCSDGLTSMVSEEGVAEILVASDSLAGAAAALIDAANRAGGRDNITVVLFRLEEAGADGVIDQATMTGVPGAVTGGGATGAPARAASPPGEERAGREREGEGREGGEHAGEERADGEHAGEERADGEQADGEQADGEQADGERASVAAQSPAKVKRLSPIPATAARSRGGPGRTGGDRRPRRRMPRVVKVIAAVFAVVVVLFLIGAGGYLASRQLYFIGTNQQGIVTIYRGLPYSLPAGINLYETFYTSGLPASQVPGDRRGDLFNNHLRSQSDATSLVRDLELGRIAK